MRAEAASGLPAAAAIVLAVTAARLVALHFDATDLYVDESQYWLWGQRPDFGYFSKPPLIGWLIGAVTAIAGSDAPFWVRMPGAILHAATALILGLMARDLYGDRAAFWVAVSYVTAPFAALGSLLISTDTVMAPFFAAALLLLFRATAGGGLAAAALAGFAAGAAVMAKYAGVYVLLGAIVAALFVPAARLRPGQWLALAAAFAVTIAPNVWWNLSHDLTTVEHTLDNARWVRGGDDLSGLHPARLATFLLSQFAVFGPILFAALLWAWAVAARRGERERRLMWMSLPVLAVVCLQALLSRAYANWAVATYFAGVLLAVALLLERAPRLLRWSLLVNGAVCILLPLATILAPWPAIGGKPLLARYLGQAALSRQIVAAAQAAGLGTIVAADRAILADLFRSAPAAGLSVHAPPASGRPANYYQQTFPLPPTAGRVLYVAERAPDCPGVETVAALDTRGGAHDGRSLAAFAVDAACLGAGEGGGDD